MKLCTYLRFAVRRSKLPSPSTMMVPHSVRALSESSLRLIVHIFFFVGLITMMGALNGIDNATIEVVDCKKSTSGSTAPDTCQPTIWLETGAKSGQEKGELNVFSQCYGGHHLFHEKDEYKFVPYIVDHVRPIVLTAIILLGIQILIALGAYTYGATRDDPDEKTKGLRYSNDLANKTWYGWGMWFLSTATSLLIGAAVVMFFVAIATRSDCGVGTVISNNLLDSTKEYVPTAAKCGDAGDAMRAYRQASTEADGGGVTWKDGPTATTNPTEGKYDDYAGIFGIPTANNDPRYQFQWANSDSTDDKKGKISAMALGAYVLNCAALDDNFQSTGTTAGDGAYVNKDIKDYKPRKELIEALESVYSNVNLTCWFLSAGCIMLLYSMYAAGVLVRTHDRLWKSMHIAFIPLVCGALFWISAGMWDLHQALGSNRDEEDPVAEKCGIYEKQVKEDFVFTEDKEKSIEKWSIFGVIGPLVISLALSYVAFSTAVHTVPMTKKKNRGAPEPADKLSTSKRQFNDKYKILDMCMIVVTAICGLTLFFVLQRVFAPLKYHASNFCPMAVSAHESRYVGGMTSAVIGGVFLILFSYLYNQFGVHGIHRASSWYAHHSGKSEVQGENEHSPANTEEETGLTA